MENRIKPRIVVIGDIMQDVDVFCSTSRMAAEAPDVPIWKTERVVKRPGGAWNVSTMCERLGADTLLVGSRWNWDSQLYGTADSQFHGTTKTRFFVNGKMVGRNDFDVGYVPDEWEMREVFSEINDYNPDAIIVADHGKGSINRRVMQGLAKMGVPLFVDPVKTTPFVDGCWCGGPHELSIETYTHASALIEKQGPMGLEYRFDKINASMGSACEILVDELGAGDQLIATLAYLRCLGLDWEFAIRQANVAAGMQCERAGCVPVTMKELQQRVNTRSVLC